MDRFNSVYSATEPEGKWLDSLKKFNDLHADDRAFESIYGASNKHSFTTNLFDILKREMDGNSVGDKPSPIAIHQALIALRISLRELISTEEPILLENLHLLLKFGNVGEDNKTTLYSDETREEALKALLNCITKNRELQARFFSLNGPVLLLNDSMYGDHNRSTTTTTTSTTTSPTSTATPLNDKILFPLYKILLHTCTVPQIRDVLIQHDLFKQLVSELDKRTQGSSFEATPILGDLFRLTFTSTMYLGPLDGGKATPPSNKDLDLVRSLFPIYKRVFTYHCDKSHPMYSIKLAVVSALLNTPKDMFDELIDIIPLTYFESILTIQAEHADRPNAPGELVPILMLLACVAENVPDTRLQLLKYTFPPELTQDGDEPLSVAIEAPKEALTKGVSSKLIPLMTSTDIGLKHFVSEYFFYICDEDANEVCRLTGYGNAAGLLVTKGLMSLGGQ